MKWVILLILCSCVNRERINAVVWNNNFYLIKEKCLTDETLRDLVFYRQLKDGKFQTLALCDMDKDDQTNQMISVTSKDFNEILDEALPKKKARNR